MDFRPSHYTWRIPEGSEDGRQQSLLFKELIFCYFLYQPSKEEILFVVYRFMENIILTDISIIFCHLRNPILAVGLSWPQDFAALLVALSTTAAAKYATLNL